jgi:uncharacterized protein YbjT (DUF2867 family)
MKITLTGSLGNVGRPLTEILVAEGHDVNVVSSHAKNKAAIEALGATARIGSVEDRSFLLDAFKGAEIVYTMVPMNLAATDYRKYTAEVGKNYAYAIHETGVSKVVNLSSIGAHLNGGTGQIAGLHDVEFIFNGLEGVSVKHLRPGYFYTNFLYDFDMIRAAGILGSNYPATTSLTMVHPIDIAEAAAKEINTTFSGKSNQYIIGDEKTLGEITSILGVVIGKPALTWVEFSDEEAFKGMLQAGMPPEIARNYVEMGTAFRNGKILEDYFLQKPIIMTKTKLETFAIEFAEKFYASIPATT